MILLNPKTLIRSICFVIGTSTHAAIVPRIIVPQPDLLRAPAISSPLLSFARSGAAVGTFIASEDAGGQGMFLTAGYAREVSEEDFRWSGWSFGIAGAATSSFNSSRGIYGPGTKSWDLVVGRGTSDFWSGGESGIRGFVEGGLHETHFQVPNSINSLLITDNSTIPHTARFLLLRIGASNDLAGKGLVDQQPTKFMFRFNGSTYFPLDGVRRRVFLALNTAGLIRCGTDRLSCGFNLNFVQSSNARELGSAQELFRFIEFGAITELKIQDDWLVRLRGGVPWLVAQRTNPRRSEAFLTRQTFSYEPSFQLEIQRAF